MTPMREPGDLEVGPGDLQEGDVIVATGRGDGRFYLGTSEHIIRITRDGADAGLDIVIYTRGAEQRHAQRREYCPHLVIRARGPVTPARDPRYPGACTRCGREAYVSALSVDHRDEVAARECPARRA